MISDIIFIGDDCEEWQKLKSRFPTAKRADDFFKAQKKSLTKMFWAVWADVIVNDDFDFSYQPDEWSREYVHVFKNGKHSDGIILCPKRAKISVKEVEYKFFTRKKEVDIQASIPKPYDVFYVSSYEEYCEAFDKSSTAMFWIVRSDLTVLPEFDFSYRVPKWEEKHVHVFKNGEYYDGVCLFNTGRLVSRNEFNYCAFVNKKEVKQLASHPKPFDVVFISYNEPNADENYQALLEKASRAKRVHGVKGIHQAHIEAARQCSTDMFWVVDGDAEIVEGFDFDYQVAKWEQDTVHVWRSENPINDLTYGYGGAKLLPVELTKQVDVESADMTTSISHKFKAVPEVSNVTAFNTDPFTTWRSAFRECTKLASSTIRGQVDDETKARLDVWCTAGRDKRFGDYAISGALSGREYGSLHKSSVQLGKINDYDWLYERFLESTDES